MEELLSLKWNNHKNGFLKLLASVRKKSAYTDVTLACDGELYNAHKIVLSACSDYFNHIFETILCPNPIIVLKDITGRNLEALLDYMYLGEVNVKQSELSSLIQAAECLKLKGLAVPDSDSAGSKKRSIDSPHSTLSKKFKRQNTKDLLSSSIYKQEEKNNIVIQVETNIDDPLHLPSTVKLEDNSSDDIISVKNETDFINESIPFDIDLKFEETKECSISTEMISSIDEKDDASRTPFLMNPYNETENTNEELFSNSVNQSFSTTSYEKQVDKTLISSKLKRMRCCPYCEKQFKTDTDINRHVRTHTGEKPFVCSYCPYKAAQKNSVKLHEAIKHTTGFDQLAHFHKKYKQTF